MVAKTPTDCPSLPVPTQDIIRPSVTILQTSVGKVNVRAPCIEIGGGQPGPTQNNTEIIYLALESLSEPSRASVRHLLLIDHNIIHGVSYKGNNTGSAGKVPWILF